MAGILNFTGQYALADAMRAGYQVYDKTANGYLVRTMTSAGWAMALVTVKS